MRDTRTTAIGRAALGHLANCAGLLHQDKKEDARRCHSRNNKQEPPEAVGTCQMARLQRVVSCSHYVLQLRHTVSHLHTHGMTFMSMLMGDHERGAASAAGTSREGKGTRHTGASQIWALMQCSETGPIRFFLRKSRELNFFSCSLEVL